MLEHEMDDFIKKLQARYGIHEEDLLSLQNLLHERKANISEALTLHDQIEEDVGVQLPYQYFQQKDILGIGASSIVHRVYDELLSRHMAMKIVKEETMTSSLSLGRFVREAQLTARLQHPGILPVHHLAQQADGRVFFTMLEVKGQTFLETIRSFHAQNTDGNIRPLIEILRKVCDAVGYAHSHGVIHRDIKPSNIMVGSYGEVWVLDWGLGIEYQKSQSKMVVGTPIYMSPEQARGESLLPSSDVYSIGCLLYYILTAQLPYTDLSSVDVIRMVMEGPPISVRKRKIPDINADEELIRICEHAMARNFQDRYHDANALRKALGDWLDGTLRRGKALEIVSEAQFFISQGKQVRRQISSLKEKAQSSLQSLPIWENELVKREAWRTEDEAERLAQQANMTFLRAEQLLHAALTYVPNLPEAHSLLCDWYQEQHQEAEYISDQSEIEKTETKLRAHVEALPDDFPKQKSYQTYLKGMGLLSLITDPEGAEVLLHRYEVVNRRLKADFVCVLGKTPIEKYPLPMGSYLVIFRKKGYHEVRYPVFIGRQEHWDGISPYTMEFEAISLPPKGCLEENEAYIPAGWYWNGGDTNALYPLPLRKIWVPSFIIQRFPISNVDYLSFLNHLVQSGQEGKAFEYVPSDTSGTRSGKGEMVYGLSRQGWFYAKKDATGLLWEDDWPVLKITSQDALAYAAYLSEKTGKKWMLPDEFQWEKAARGVDKRLFPWGNFMDPAWTCMRQSHRTDQKPQTVHASSIDISPFGVYGMGGNARDLTSTPFSLDGPKVENGCYQKEEMKEGVDFYVVRGGSWYDHGQFIRSCSRSSEHRLKGSPLLSFRLLRMPNW